MELFRSVPPEISGRDLSSPRISGLLRSRVRIRSDPGPTPLSKLCLPNNPSEPILHHPRTDQEHPPKPLVQWNTTSEKLTHPDMALPTQTIEVLHGTYTMARDGTRNLCQLKEVIRIVLPIISCSALYKTVPKV